MTELCWSETTVCVGILGVVADEQSIQRIYFLNDRRALERVLSADYPSLTGASKNLLVEEALDQLIAYFSSERKTFNLPLSDARLTPFARRVHHALCQVPFGELISYGDLATKAGSPGAARAVGAVMAGNPFPLVVPCHRVVRGDRSIGEYSGADGTATKRWLIDYEQAHA